MKDKHDTPRNSVLTKHCSFLEERLFLLLQTRKVFVRLLALENFSYMRPLRTGTYRSIWSHPFGQTHMLKRDEPPVRVCLQTSHLVVAMIASSQSPCIILSVNSDVYKADDHEPLLLPSEGLVDGIDNRGFGQDFFVNSIHCNNQTLFHCNGHANGKQQTEHDHRSCRIDQRQSSPHGHLQTADNRYMETMGRIE